MKGFDSFYLAAVTACIFVFVTAVLISVSNCIVNTSSKRTLAFVSIIALIMFVLFVCADSYNAVKELLLNNIFLTVLNFISALLIPIIYLLYIGESFMNKKLFLLPIMAIVLILGGCSNSNRIDTSSLVQTITAENKSGKAVYNFYLLENSEDVQGVSVEADSLEKAVISAKKAYIPALTLSKLELYLIDSNLGEKLSKPILTIFQKKPQFHL